MRLLIFLFLTAVLTANTSLCGAEEASNVEKSTAEPSREEVESARSRAFDVVKRLVEETDSRKARGIEKELDEVGPAAIDYLWRHAKRHEREEIRLRCYEALSKHFAGSSAVEERIAHDGLSDPSERVRYHCAWQVGELKYYGGHRRLRRLMEDSKEPESVRHAAAKSLAELGEPDVIVELVRDMADDNYMPRYMANVGAKALTGKNLNDFGDYDYGEGAFISGGIEMVMAHPHPVSVHEKTAKRHATIAAYCEWLEKNRPEIFKHLYAPW